MSLGLAIDPGYASLGLCVAQDGAKITVCDVKTVYTNSTMTPGGRLDALAMHLLHAADDWDLDWVAYEDQAGVTAGTAAPFQSAASRRVHEVSGMVRMLARARRLPLTVLDPKTVKKAVTGHGLAKKGDVKECVKNLMGIQGRISEHAADACAVWLAASRRMRLPGVRGPLRLVTTSGNS